MNTDLLALLPHRPPMLLLNEAVDVGADYAVSTVCISQQSSFFVKDKGVPAVIGIEYMGQTAALIAGYQLQKGDIQPHIGMLLGTRRYRCSDSWFAPMVELRIECRQIAAAQDSLASFRCEIYRMNNKKEQQKSTKGALTAEANLTVYRKPLETS